MLFYVIANLFYYLAKELGDSENYEKLMKRTGVDVMKKLEQLYEGKAKKVFAAILTLALVCFTAATSVSVNAATNTSWNFKIPASRILVR